MATVHREGDLIAHRPGGEKEGGLLPQQVSYHVLEEIDGGIFALLLIAHLGVGHSLAHGRSGTGDGVAEQVYAYHSIDSILRRANRSGTIVAVMQMAATKIADAMSPGTMSTSRPPYRSTRR